VSVHELNPQYARVMCLTADHPLYAHVRAQKRCGAILLESFSLERQGPGMPCRISSVHSTKFCFPKYKNPVDSLILGAGGMRGGDFWDFENSLHLYGVSAILHL